MIHLELLGGVSVVVDGRPLSGRAAQPRRLAILAVLAASPRCSATRDRLAALLWPESPEPSARKLLATALYELRRGLGSDALSTPGDRIALDPTRVRSDVARFREMASTAPTAAADLYRGPFLDGFHLRGAPTFDEWLEAERSELARLQGRALEAAAALRTAAGETAAALELLRRRARHLPTDASAARALMEALAASGDRAAALEHARRYVADAEERFGIVPDPEIADLARTLRSRGATGDSLDLPSLDPPRAPESPCPQPVSDLLLDPPRPARPRPRRGWMALTAGAVAITAVVAIGRPAAPEDPPPGSRVFVVAPFRVSAPDTAYEYLEEGAVDLVNALLIAGGVGGAVDSRTVLRRWPARESPPGLSGDPQAATGVATGLGAHRIIVGDLVATTRRVTLTARMLRARDGAVLAEAVEAAGRGEVDEVTLLQRLVGRLLVAAEGDPRARAAVLSDSLDAVRAYLAGRRAVRDGRWTDAYGHYERALATDPTFAAAAAAQVAAGWWLTPATEAEWVRVLSRAWELRDRLPPADRAIVDAQVGPSFPRASTWRGHIEAARTAARLNPWSADALGWLGKLLLLWGASAEIPEWHAEAVIALDSAVALDSGFVKTLSDRLYAAVIVGDTAAVRRVGGDFLRRSPAGDRTEVNRWLIAAATGDSSAMAALSPKLREISGDEIDFLTNVGILAGLPLDPIESELERRALRALEGSAPRCESLQLLMVVAAARGQADRAYDLARSIRRPGCGRHPAMALSLTEAVFPPILEHFVQTNPPRFDSPSQFCFVELHRVLDGDTTRAREAADHLRRVGDRAPPTPWQRIGGHHVCASLIETAVAVASASDPRLALDDLESLLEEGVEWEVPAGANALLARWLEEAGDPASALRAVRRRSYGWNTTFTTALPGMLRTEGRLAAEVGDTAGAVRAYERYLKLRDRPETAALREERRRVEAHLRSLREPS